MPDDSSDGQAKWIDGRVASIVAPASRRVDFFLSSATSPSR